MLKSALSLAAIFIFVGWLAVKAWEASASAPTTIPATTTTAPATTTTAGPPPPASTAPTTTLAVPATTLPVLVDGWAPPATWEGRAIREGVGLCVANGKRAERTSEGECMRRVNDYQSGGE